MRERSESSPASLLRHNRGRVISALREHGIGARGVGIDNGLGLLGVLLLAVTVGSISRRGREQSARA